MAAEAKVMTAPPLQALEAQLVRLAALMLEPAEPAEPVELAVATELQDPQVIPVQRVLMETSPMALLEALEVAVGWPAFTSTGFQLILLLLMQALLPEGPTNANLLHH